MLTSLTQQKVNAALGIRSTLYLCHLAQQNLTAHLKRKMKSRYLYNKIALRLCDEIKLTSTH